jgi:surface antigen
VLAAGLAALTAVGGCAMPVSIPLGPLAGLTGSKQESGLTTASAGPRIEEEGISDRLGTGGWDAVRSAILRAIEGGEDGETFAWRSETNGLAGTVTPVSAYFGETGSVCRRLAITAARSDLSDVFLAEACRADSGHWRVTSTAGEA